MKEYEDSFILLYQRSENGKIVVNHFTCKYLWELYKKSSTFKLDFCKTNLIFYMHIFLLVYF